MELSQLNILVTLANQKGGVAKSTLTAVLANTLQYRTGLNVCICDMDRQQSIYKARQVDLTYLENGELIPFGIQSESDLYPVFSYHGERAFSRFHEDYKSTLRHDFNIIFLDVPGSLDQNFITYIGLVDLLIVPANINSDDLTPTLDMLDIVETQIEPIRKEAIPKYFLPSKVDPRTSIVKQIEEFKANMPIPVLDTYFPNWPGVFGNIQTYTSYENLIDERSREKKQEVLDDIVEKFLEVVLKVANEK